MYTAQGWHLRQSIINQNGIHDLYKYYKHTILSTTEFVDLFAKDYFFGNRNRCRKTYYLITEGK